MQTPEAARAAIRLVKKMGAGAADLLRRLKKDKSPQAMLDSIDASVAANAQRREGVSARLEKAHADIVAKKEAYAKAAPARRRILEAELKSLLAGYKAAERELTVLLENERVLSQVRGRMMEVLSYGMAGVTELQIDELADEIEAAAADAEGRTDAARELEKAGRRRERDSDRETFLDELEEFETGAAAAASDTPRVSGETPYPPEITPERKPAEEEKM